MGLGLPDEAPSLRKIECEESERWRGIAERLEKENEELTETLDALKIFVESMWNLLGST
jgi:hypothetical protein